MQSGEAGLQSTLEDGHFKGQINQRLFRHSRKDNRTLSLFVLFFLVFSCIAMLLVYMSFSLECPVDTHKPHCSTRMKSNLNTEVISSSTRTRQPVGLILCSYAFCCNIYAASSFHLKDYGSYFTSNRLRSREWYSGAFQTTLACFVFLGMLCVSISSCITRRLI